MGTLPYAFRSEPVLLVSAIGRAWMGADFDAAWARYALRVRPVREALGPWIMGHASDLGLACATAAFVDTMQDGASRRARLGWQAAATCVLVGLELLQAPLGFGTFDPVDVAVLLVGALVVVAASEGARARRRLV